MATTLQCALNNDTNWSTCANTTYGAVIQQVRKSRGRQWPWLVELVKRKPPKLVAVALANKMARAAWAVVTKGEAYRTA